MRWICLLLVACGSAPPPAPAPIPAPEPPPAPAAVSCADAGVILRGAVEDSRKAGPAKEAAIASVCLHDKWSRDVLDCVGAIAEAEAERHAAQSKACIAKLSTEQRAALDTKLTAWTETYEGESWETAEAERIANEPPPIGCSTVVTHGAMAKLAPELRLAGEELGFATIARWSALSAACESWPRSVRACVADEGLPLATCRSRLPPADEQVVATRLAEIDATMVKIVAAKKKPAATYECKAVVAAHYSDQAWRGKADPPKNPQATRAELAKQVADRKQLIADSRKQMLDACLTEGWSATLRACELVDGGDVCANGNARPRTRWGFPPTRLVKIRTGIAECDAYGGSIQSLLTCDKVPQATKQALEQGFEAMLNGFASAQKSPDLLRMQAQACKQGDDAIRQAASALGCSP